MFLVRIGKIPIAGKKLFPSSIRRIGCMSRDVGKSTEDFCQENDDNCSKLSAQVLEIFFAHYLFINATSF
jgi:hypothetical protein